MPTFSQSLEQSLHRALAIANERHHQYATLEHLLLSLIDDSDAAAVMRACSVDLDKLRTSLVNYLETEFENLVTLAVFSLAVGHPDVAVVIHIEAVREHEQPFAETFHQIARRIEFQNRRQIRFGARSSAAPFDHPYALAVAIDVRADHLSPRTPLGQLRPVLHGAIRIRRGIGIGLRRCLLARYSGQKGENNPKRGDVAIHM